MSALLDLDRSDHPLADAERRAEILADLPKAPTRALEALAGFAEAMHEAPGIAPLERARAILDIDAAGQNHVRRLMREFVGERDKADNANGRERALWSTVRHFLELDAQALADLADACHPDTRGSGALKSVAHLVAVRTIRVCGQLSKWLAMRYGPHDAHLWRHAGRARLLAERMKLLGRPIVPYAATGAETTAEKEFVRLVAFAASSPGSLAIGQIEAMDRLIAHLAAHFTIIDAPRTGAHYWIDLAEARPPARFARALKPRDTLRFIMGVDIMPRLQDMQYRLAAGEALVDAPAVDDVCDERSLASVIEHLRVFWAEKVPIRKHLHHPLKSSIDVVRGFDDVIDALLTAEASASGLAPAMPAMQCWTTENASAGGFAAIVPAGCDEGIRIGELVAAKTPQSRAWQIGMVRRLERLQDERLFVAVELLQGAAAATEVAVRAGGHVAPQPEVAILLGDAAGEEPVHLVVRAGVHAPGDDYLPEHLYRRTALVPDMLPRTGPDYAVLRCRPRRNTLVD